ncbi:MAG TPA: peptidylprolyl isomerase [Candidatus Paceibacterota bacterium]
MKRIWFPGLIALIIVGGLIWYFAGSGNGVSVLKDAPETAADLFSTSTSQTGGAQGANGQGGEAQGPQLPTGAGQNNNQNIMNAILHTNMGDITIEFSKSTPNTVANFVKLAKEGFYNGTKFHRVIEGFMNQGGDPLTKDDSKMAYWGTGGPGYKFADEITADNKNDAGTISMANAGPNTNGSQFFINVAANNFLDSKHTVFGRVTAGAEVVMAINGVETGEADRPLKPVVINSIELK